MNSETVSMDTAVSETLDKSVTSVTDDGNKLSQIALMTSLQLSRFLVKNEAKLTVTQMRPLCKFLGAQEKDINIDDVRGKKAQLRELKECMDELTYLESSTKKALCPLVELLSNVKEYEDDNDDDERSFDKLFIGDDKSLDESSSNKESDSQSAGDTTVEDEIMLNISRLSLMNKENPPSVVKTYRKSRRSSNQSVLEYIGSPMTNT
jgi:ferritin